MAVTLVAFVAAQARRESMDTAALITPAHQDLAASTPLDRGLRHERQACSGSAAGTLQPAPPNIPGAWIYSTELVGTAGHAISAQSAERLPGPRCGPVSQRTSRRVGSGGRAATYRHCREGALRDCAVKVAARFHEVVTYQPASRYGPFQWYELAIFLGPPSRWCLLLVDVRLKKKKKKKKKKKVGRRCE